MELVNKEIEIVKYGYTWFYSKKFILYYIYTQLLFLLFPFILYPFSKSNLILPVFPFILFMFDWFIFFRPPIKSKLSETYYDNRVPDDSALKDEFITEVNSLDRGRLIVSVASSILFYLFYFLTRNIFSGINNLMANIGLFLFFTFLLSHGRIGFISTPKDKLDALEEKIAEENINELKNMKFLNKLYKKIER